MKGKYIDWFLWLVLGWQVQFFNFNQGWWVYSLFGV